ncbi:winged helix-turn-helix domain-containing protein [Methylobacterium nigriterrae]|uniref:winged helix-turn-helix domain-containing protein n=1 Tax=Methylobacterium nigriterrae TaxID=3127512 RepID=UPI003013D628
MVPSEAEIEARLAELRRQRDALDRSIADHVLYLELGRRLRAERAPEPAAVPSAPTPSPPGWPGAIGGARPGPRAEAGLPVQDAPLQDPPHPPPHSSPSPRPAPAAGLPVPPVPFEEDPVAARRYGRAVIEAALGVLEEAGRPLHAGEILARLARQGFTLPGQDPVAALNTRLWKRSGPGGPVRRMGDAVYALAEG